MQTVENTINTVLRDLDQSPNCQHVRLPVVKAMLGVSSATVWRMVKNKQLKSYKLTERTTSFRIGDIRALIASKVEA